MIKTPLLIARYPGDTRIQKQVEDARKRLIIDVNRNRTKIVVNDVKH